MSNQSSAQWTLPLCKPRSAHSFLIAIPIALILFGGQTLAADCNTNGQDDALDISSGVSLDCDDNGVPDECQFLSVQIAKLLADAPVSSAKFGSSVSIDGNTAVITAPSTFSSQSIGMAYVFRKTNGVWLQADKFSGHDTVPLDDFGSSVSLSGGTLIIGARFDDDDGTSSGSAYVFAENAGSWQEVAKLTASDADENDWFGKSVAISGDTAIVGAPNNDDAGDSSGSAYIFREVNGVWGQIAKIRQSDGMSLASFGESVAISGDTAIIGADESQFSDHGSAYVFREIGGTWQQIAKIVASDGAIGDRFGISVALHDDTAIIGAFLDNHIGTDRGSAYLFRDVGGSWQQIAKLVSSDGASDDWFGHSVAIHEDTVVVAARNNDGNGIDRGASYVFRELQGTWQQIVRLGVDDGAENDGFGVGVGISGDSVFVGTPFSDTPGTDNGVTYIFDILPENPGVPCDDGDFCTTCDALLNGTCAGVPVDCSSLDDACAVGVCNPIDGSCETSPANEGAACDDQDICTSDDVCAGGTCVGTLLDCSHLDDVCVQGVCHPGVGFCVTSWVDQGEVCDDSDLCTLNDVCVNGACTGSPVDCSFLDDACLPGVCNTDTGECEAPTPGEDCNLNSVPDSCEIAGAQTAKLGPPASSFPGEFGYSVAISGNLIVVGANKDIGASTTSGASYVFRHVDGEWERIAKLAPADGATADRFGYRVAVDQVTAVIGAPYDDVGSRTDSGSVYVFRDINGTWQQIAKLTPSDAASSDFFGQAVAIDGDTIIAGAYRDDDAGESSGSSYVFREIGGVWQQVAKLTASDAAEEDWFGSSVAIQSSTAVVGAYANDDAGSYSGSAYVFREIGSSWQQVSKLTAADAAGGDQFGSSVAIDGETIVIGASSEAAQRGSVYVFREADGSWTEIAKLTADDAAQGDFFGRSVAISGRVVVAGAYGDDDNGSLSGSSYVFRESAESWSQVDKNIADEGANSDRFGFSVAIDATTVVVGAYGNDSIAPERGAAFVFAVPAFDCNNNGVPDECEANFDGDGLIDACDPCAGGVASGDSDANGILNLADFAALEPCLIGPADGLGEGCECFDFDDDADNDLHDFAAFQAIFSP